MKFIRKKLWLFHIVFFFSFIASTYANSISLDGEGDVAIWDFYQDNTTVTFDGNRAADKFFGHCNGKNKIYIYEFGSKGYVCDSFYNYESKYYGFEIQGLTLPQKNHEFTPVTVSLRKIQQQKWNINRPDKAELLKVNKIVQKHKLKRPSDKICKEREWESLCSDSILDVFGKYGKYQKKINLKNLELLIIPSQRIDHGVGWEISSAVIAKNNGVYKYIGSFDGCLINQPVDINGDGIPELMTEYCENYEGYGFTYHKIYPSVKFLVYEGS